MARSKWGVTVAGSSYAKSTTWGETADPDHDGLPNLLEYACSIDRTRHNLASDCDQFIVTAEGALSSRFRQTYTLLRITCQTSSDLVSWYPDVPSISISRLQSTPMC